MVRDAKNGLRDGMDGSAYPLAEWIAYNWWPLTASQRPSAYDAARWSWRLLPEQEWLRHHNMRAANEGQSWPDLTFVREGGVFCALWSADRADTPGPVRFLTSGKAFVPAAQVVRAPRAFVEDVLLRLADQGVDDTTLAREWRRVQASETDPEEAFCRAAARLGLDPFDVPEDVEENLQPYGLRGYGTTTPTDVCALLVPGALGPAAKRFAAARALGRALFRPTGAEFLLTGTRAAHEQMARAFAAELLAPAGGIQELLLALGTDSDGAYEVVASRYGVQPAVVRYQVGNQLQ